MFAGQPPFQAATMLAARSDARGVLAALVFAALLTAALAALALWKPQLRRSHFLPRLGGWFLLIFVLSLFRYGVLHLASMTALVLLVALLAVCVGLDWRNHRGHRS